MARGKKPREDASEDEFLRELRARSDGGGGYGSRPIDGALLSMVVAAVQRRGGQISFGTTQDGSKATITAWYKGFPTKAYVESVEEMERHLAYTLDIWLPKGEEHEEWRNYAEAYK